MAWGFTYRRPHDPQLQKAKDWPAPSAVAASTGVLAATQAADSAALSGTVGVTAALAATQAADSAALVGTVGVGGTLAATQEGDTCAIVGAVTTASDRLTKHEGAKKFRPRFKATEFDGTIVVQVSGATEQPRQQTYGAIGIANPVEANGSFEQHSQHTTGEVHQDLRRVINRRKAQLAILMAA